MLDQCELFAIESNRIDSNLLDGRGKGVWCGACQRKTASMRVAQPDVILLQLASLQTCPALP